MSLNNFFDGQANKGKAEKYTAALDKVIVQKAVTGFMIDNGLKAQLGRKGQC